jgi:hypothetical protein
VVTSVRSWLVISRIQNIELYPNPANNRIYLDITSEKSEKVIITLYSLTGQPLTVVNENLHSGKQVIPVKLDQLPAGMYLIRAVTNTGCIWQQNLVKKN